MVSSVLHPWFQHLSLTASHPTLEHVLLFPACCSLMFCDVGIASRHAKHKEQNKAAGGQKVNLTKPINHTVCSAVVPGGGEEEGGSHVTTQTQLWSCHS